MGRSASADGSSSRAFLYVDGQMVDLNNTVSLAGWTLTNAAAINDSGRIVCSAKSNDGQSFRTYLLVTSASGPVITAQPQPKVLVVGSAAAFTVAADGPGSLRYQWQKNGAPISGATSDSYAITSAQTGDAGDYAVTITNGSGSVTSIAAKLAAAAPPAITAPPQSQSANVGDSVLLSVTATGMPAPSYQWQKNGTNITGATQANFSILTLQAGDAANYTVVVSNDSATMISAAAVVTVNTQPRITSNFSAKEVNVGASTTFSITTTGTAPFSYQWLRNGVPISGATSASYAIASVQSGDLGAYAITISNVAGSITTNVGTLAFAVPPTITAQPKASLTTGVAGFTTQFTVTATGSQPLSYQWMKDGVPIVGATSPSYFLSSAKEGDAGSYTVAISNLAGSITGIPVTLTVLVPVTVITPPQGQTVRDGTAVTLSVVATGTAPLTYQWEKNGILISGATASTYQIPSALVGNGGRYYVHVTNPLGTVILAADITVIATPPVFTLQPRNQNVVPGTSATFTAAVSSIEPVSYQWRKNGSDIAYAPNSPTFTIASAQASDIGAYTVVVYYSTDGLNGFGTVTSSPAALTVGADGLASVQSSNAGSYSVKITNTAGTITSSAATLTVTDAVFAGTYFGTFSGNQGSWALYVRKDGTGVWVAYLAAMKAAFVSNVTIKTDGTFGVVGTVGTSTGPALLAVVGEKPRVEAAPQSLILSGQINSSGQVTGQLTGGASASVSGAVDAPSGTSAVSAGVYTAAALNAASGSAYSVVGPSGHAFVVTSTAAGADSATGTMSASGQLTATTASGAQFSLTLNAQSQTIVATFTPAGATTATSFSGLTDGVASTSRVLNLSVLTSIASAGDTFTLGYVVGGDGTSGTKPLVIRAAGPSLGALGVGGVLADPKIELFTGSIKSGENDNWGGTLATTAAMANVGAFDYASITSKDAATVANITSRDNSVRVSASDNGTGTVIAEIYDATQAASFARSTPRLINVSLLKNIGSGLTAGFVIGGVGTKTVLIRAVGPTLGAAPFSIGGAADDLQLTLFDGASKRIGSNDNWGTPVGEGAATAAQLTTTFTQVGAFALISGSKDAAFLATLAPGNYTVQVSGVGGATGFALVEIYEVP